MKKMMAKMWKNEKGFTLIELIIVIAILAVIAAIAVPNLINNINDARKRTDVSNAQLIANTVAQVVANNDAYAGVAVTKTAFNLSSSAIIADAQTQLQSIPVIKSNNSSLTNKNFYVTVTSNGGIKIDDEDAVELFPVPASLYK